MKYLSPKYSNSFYLFCRDSKEVYICGKTSTFSLPKGKTQFCRIVVNIVVFKSMRGWEDQD